MIKLDCIRTSTLTKYFICGCIAGTFFSCQTNTSSTEMTVLKNCIENDLETAQQQRLELSLSLQQYYAENPQKFQELNNNHYKNLSEATNAMLGQIDAERQKVKAGKNANKNELMAAIGEYQKEIDKIYGEVNKKRPGKQIPSIKIDASSNAILSSDDFDKSSVEVQNIVLAKLANDVINTEIKATKCLIDTYRYGEFTFNQCQAVVLAKDQYKVGENLDAYILLAARDTTKPAEIMVNGKVIDGPHLVMPCTSVGNKTLQGSYTIFSETVMYVFNFQYDYTVTK